MDLVDLIILIGLAGFILFHLAAFTLYLVEHLQVICHRPTRLARIMAEAATNTPQPLTDDSPSWLDGVLLCLSPSMRAEFSAFMDGLPARPITLSSRQSLEGLCPLVSSEAPSPASLSQ